MILSTFWKETSGQIYALKPCRSNMQAVVMEGIPLNKPTAAWVKPAQCDFVPDFKHIPDAYSSNASFLIKNLFETREFNMQ